MTLYRAELMYEGTVCTQMPESSTLGVEVKVQLVFEDHCWFQALATPTHGTRVEHLTQTFDSLKKSTQRLPSTYHDARFDALIRNCEDGC